MKKITFILTVLLTIVLSSCSLDVITDTNYYSAEKTEAWDVYGQAREAFFSTIGETESRALDDSGFSLQDQITGLAWEAYLSGDSSELMDFLESRNLTSLYENIVQEYAIADANEVLGKKAETRAITETFFDSYIDGDVFLSYSKEDSSSKLIGFFIPGHWKHAGFMDRTNPWNSDPNWCVLSANSGTTHGFAVGYESRAKWAASTAVAGLRVRGRTDTKARAALDYSRQYLGQPYSVFTSRSSNSSWYCSKVVWRGWDSQGIDLEYNTWYYWRGQWVTPQDLWDDSDTYFIGGDPN
jgi:hypothetical protein